MMLFTWLLPQKQSQLFRENRSLSLRASKAKLQSAQAGLRQTRKMIVRGFTLIELLITLSILVILISLAIPSFRDARLKSDANTLGNEFVMGLAYARSEAISRNRCVSMCISTNTTTDPPTCSATATDWNAGWIIFANPLCDDSPTDTTAELLKIYTGYPTGATLVTNGVTIRNLRYDARGNGSIAQARELRLAPSGAGYNTVICISSGGRVNVNRNTVPSCN
jgi:type IV fimbrial biogenesis protein FimT